ncbi:MAG: thioesterase [Desulfobacterales bacterium]|nr:thioesterase [Desulfobacterales bacterium]
MTDENDQFECGIWDKEGSCMIPLALLESLPVYHRKTIPADYQDIMGHMNIRWYFDLFAKSGRKFFKSHGLDEDYFRGGKFGVFTLKQFIQYFAEVRVGQTVAIHARLIGRSDKRFHFMLFMLNQSTNQLASTFEALITHADLKIRRAAPMPSQIVQKFDATLAGDQKLDWKAPISEAIRI